METQRYTSVAIILHWVIAAAIVYQLWLGFAMPHGDEVSSVAEFQMIQLHKSVGITILLLSALRLGWRLGHKPPSLPDGMAVWERLGARISHVGFYVLMIGVPMLGWAMVSASPLGIDTELFGVIPWPHLPGFGGLENKAAVEDALAEAHELFAKGIIGLLLLHVAAALKHQFVSRDGVLTRMIPFLPQNR